MPLRDAKLEEFRNLFEELEVIILDELSMIGSDMLYDVYTQCGPTWKSGKSAMSQKLFKLG